jgi:hypothetical protein
MLRQFFLDDQEIEVDVPQGVGGVDLEPQGMQTRSADFQFLPGGFWILNLKVAGAKVSAVTPQDFFLYLLLLLFRDQTHDQVLYPERRALSNSFGIRIVINHPLDFFLHVCEIVLQRNVVHPRLQQLFYDPRGEAGCWHQND